MRYLITVLAAITLVSCSRDPAYLKQKFLDSGNKYYEQKRYREANIMYRKALDKDRKFGPAWYKLALVDLELQRPADAVAALRRAYEVLPKNTPDSDDAALKLSEIILMSARGTALPAELTAEVQGMVDGLLKRNPASWQGHKLQGDMKLLATASMARDGNPTEAKQDMASAIQEYRTALASKKGDYVITLALGRTLALGGETAEAETLFKGLVEQDKTNLGAYTELYRIYYVQQKLPEAEAILKSAIAAVPKDSDPRMMLAQFYNNTKRPDDLALLLNDMKKDLKLFPKAYLQTGDFYVRQNQFDNALKQYEEGTKKDPAQKTDYLKREIEVYIRQDNMAMAQSKNDQILRDDPKDPEARGLRATMMLNKGDLASLNQAEGELQAVVTARPANWVARFNLGRAHFAKGEYERALQEFNKCIDLNPGYLPAHYAQTQVDIVLQNFEAANHDADALLKIAPNSIQGRVMKAAALQKLSKYDEARKLLTEVLDQDPKQEETLLEMGVLDLNQKKTKDALDHFRRAYEAAPQNIRGLLGESKALLLDGQPDKSVDLIRQAAQTKPSLELQRELGNAQMGARQFDAAIDTYQSLVKTATDVKVKGDLYSRIAQAYRYKGDNLKSIEFMEMAAKDLPDNGSIDTNLALLYDAVGNQQSARSYYERALSVNPNDPLALNNLAYLITETNGDFNKAMTYATRAQQRLPNFLEVSDTIGWIDLKKGMPDNAIDEFKRLVAQAPLIPTYHYHYCMALKQKGDLAAAKTECQMALTNRPSKQLEDQIRELQASLK